MEYTMLKYVNKTIKSILVILVTLGYTIAYAKTNRHLYVISDLHMGVGKVTDNSKEWKDREWDKLEDFRWHDGFDRFIDDIIKESKNHADLVIAGDFLELWQGRDDLCNHENNDLGCSEEEAMIRLRRVTSEHQKVFKSLKKFLKVEGNKLIIIPGNHDAALLFPKVAEHTLSQFGKEKQNVTISSSGIWLNEDKRIIVDHGHQVEYDVNRFVKWPKPFIKCKGVKYLRKTAGEQLVQKLFNDLEDDLPLVDNLASEWQGFKTALNSGRWKELGSVLSSSVIFLFEHMSWAHAGDILGEEKILDVNITAVRKNEGQTFFYNAIEENTTLHIALKKLVTEKKMNTSIDNLSDKTIKKICDYRFKLYQNQQDNNIPNTVKPCDSQSSNSLGAIAHGIFGESDKSSMAKYIQKLESNLIDKNKTNGLITYIFGHTHKYQYNETYKVGNWEMFVLNTGAWQRVASVDKLKEIANGKDIFSLKLENIPECYTYVSAKGYKKPLEMKVELKKWGKGCKIWE